MTSSNSYHHLNQLLALRHKHALTIPSHTSLRTETKAPSPHSSPAFTSSQARVNTHTHTYTYETLYISPNTNSAPTVYPKDSQNLAGLERLILMVTTASNKPF